MQVSDWLAIVALVVAAAAIALEVRRWIESGPTLCLSAMPDAKTFPLDDGNYKLALTITNRGYPNDNNT